MHRAQEDLSRQAAGRGPARTRSGSRGRGECFGVLGPNGAGKTTTIEILEGLLDATDGEVEILGMQWRQPRRRHPPADRASRSRRPSSPTSSRSARRWSFSAASSTATASSPRMPSPGCRWRTRPIAGVKNLSGGQKQRLAVAVALVGRSGAVVPRRADDGTGPELARRQLWEIIVECRRQGRTTLLTTHYMEEAERLCDRRGHRGPRAGHRLGFARAS